MLSTNLPEVACIAIVQTVTTIDNAFRSFRLSPNYAPGKSAIVLQPHGTHSRALARFLLLDRNSNIHIAGTDSMIEIVSKYKRLGTLAAANVSLALKIGERGKRHAASMRPIS